MIRVPNSSRLGSPRLLSWRRRSVSPRDGRQGQELTPHPENWRPNRLSRPANSGAAGSSLCRPLGRRDPEQQPPLPRRGRSTLLPRQCTGARSACCSCAEATRSRCLSILDTATDCVAVTRDAARDISVKMCPMRLALWNGPKATIREAKGCYLEPGAGSGHFTADPSYAISYASYDTNTKSIRLGVILAHRAIEQCSQTVPLYPQGGSP